MQGQRGCPQDKVTSKVDTKEAGDSKSDGYDFFHKVEAKLNELKKKKEEADRERAEHETRLKQVRTSWSNFKPFPSFDKSMAG